MAAESFPRFKCGILHLHEGMSNTVFMINVSWKQSSNTSWQLNKCVYSNVQTASDEW